MDDVQSSIDHRGVSLQKVGVKGVRLPFSIRTKAGGFQHVVATIDAAVDLPHDYKGTHMSRFLEVLDAWRNKPVSMVELEDMAKDICVRLQAGRAHVCFSFIYFIEKAAPVSGIRSLVDYNCSFEAAYDEDGTFDFILSVEVPFTSLCPCSKEISRYGAHNQRGMMRARLRCRPGVLHWLEDLVAAMEAQGSAPVYSLLKRQDEKFVTEQAYENPKFVEDVIRDLILLFRGLKGVLWFDIECENFESIHNHSAYVAHSEWVEGETGK